MHDCCDCYMTLGLRARPARGRARGAAALLALRARLRGAATQGRRACRRGGPSGGGQEEGGVVATEKEYMYSYSTERGGACAFSTCTLSRARAPLLCAMKARCSRQGSRRGATDASGVCSLVFGASLWAWLKPLPPLGRDAVCSLCATPSSHPSRRHTTPECKRGLHLHRAS